MNIQDLIKRELDKIKEIPRLKNSDGYAFEFSEEYEELINKQKWNFFDEMPENPRRVFKSYCRFLLESKIVPKGTKFFVFGSYSRGTAIGSFSDEKLISIYRKHTKKSFSDYDLAIELPLGYNRNDINIPNFDFAFGKADDDQTLINLD